MTGFIGATEVIETGDIRVSAFREYDAIAGLLVTEYEFSRGSEQLLLTAAR